MDSRTKVLTAKDFPQIKKLKKKFKIYRVTDTHGKNKLEMVEMLNGQRAFRGCAKSTKKAFKAAHKELKLHYKKCA
jgi:hypothetical protein